MTGLEMWPPPERVRRFREALTIIDRLLHGEVVTYEGRFHRVHEATLDAEPVQTPRPPLTIGGRGPSMLKLTAAFADAWNTGGGPGSLDEVSARIRATNEQLDGFALAAGREPAQIRRSLLDGFTEDRPWASLDAFHDFIGRYRELGITEFVFNYPPEEWHPAGTVQPGLVERVAHEVLAAPRASTGASPPRTPALGSIISSP
jgi:alkanesulfonate monooxygenase SsuD/methylene tetrahydromethanopterin reductase-like flavin-dependent oxidoreductase (luciferase family)